VINRAMARAAIRRLMPGPEAVTLKVRGVADAFTSYSLGAAQRRQWDLSEDQGDAVTTPVFRLRWAIRQETLDAVSAPRPKPGDVILDSSSVSWVVQDTASSLFDSYHVMQCVRQA
jgi:hypothetical protein